MATAEIIGLVEIDALFAETSCILILQKKHFQRQIERPYSVDQGGDFQ